MPEKIAHEGQLKNILEAYSYDVSVKEFIGADWVMDFYHFHKLSGSSHNAIKPLIEYIESNYDRELTHQEIYERFGINRHKLNELFKSITGISFHQYLVNTRIIKARELLENPNTTTTQACFESGFNDYAHFIRTFTKAMGISPGKYARQFMK